MPRADVVAGHAGFADRRQVGCLWRASGGGEGGGGEMPGPRSLPVLIGGIDAEALASATSICPLMRATVAGAPLLYGTWFIFTPASMARYSNARWLVLPDDA